MSKPYDSTLKLILDDFALDSLKWLARWIHIPLGDGSPVILPSELSTVQLAADKVFKLPGQNGLLHLEVQAGWDGELPERMHEYNTLLDRQHGGPVHSVAILLRREANASGITGQFTRSQSNGRRYLTFDYDVIRVWELNANELLAGGLGTAPLGLLTDDAQPQLPALVRRFADRVEREVPNDPQQNQFLA